LQRLSLALALALEGEQRFTANAAHELLAPLAASKTEVQLCQLQLGDERAIARLDRISQRVDRASHTVAQLLTLARLDPDDPVVRQRVSLHSLLRQALADKSYLADERKLTIELESDAGAFISGSEDSLGILL
jgi:signal transduction histidine kinase